MSNEIFDDNFVEHISRYIGETVTIFTTSGVSRAQALPALFSALIAALSG